MNRLQVAGVFPAVHGMTFMPLLEIKLHLAHGSPSFPSGMFLLVVYLQSYGLGSQDRLTPCGLSSCPPLFPFALID